MKVTEVQIDRLVGPTYHYGGLSLGNIASMASKSQTSSPLNAFLEGLDKMRMVAQSGVLQAILPPQTRPEIAFLRRIGYTGNDMHLLQEAYQKTPAFFKASFASSAVWMANSATVCASSDSQDKHVHITPANLLYYPHRSLETHTTAKDLRIVFPIQKGFIHHDPLPSTYGLSDEGSANHILLNQGAGTKGLHVFVYGRTFYEADSLQSLGQFPARQTKEACQALARLHQIPPENALFLEQNAEAIQAGVFHNDVISVGHESLFICHEQAFTNTEKAIEQIKESSLKNGIKLKCILIKSADLSLKEAAESYLFNMQILRTSSEKRLILVSEEAVKQERSRLILEELKKQIEDLEAIKVVPLGNSMRNGGGPACLRLRLVLTSAEQKAVHPFVWWNEDLDANLRQIAKRWYRPELTLQDLLNTDLHKETRCAQREIEELLQWEET